MPTYTFKSFTVTGHGKGHLPGLVLFDLQRKEKVLKEALAVLKRGKVNV